MESSSMYSSMGSGMLGLEMSLHHPPPAQNPLQQNPHPQLVAFGDQTQQPVRQSDSYPPKPKPQQLTFSDDEDSGEGKRKATPWQRMKWTDGMVRLLIMAVFYFGDEAASDGSDPKRKGGAGSGGVLQKKGKWKSVSRAMMEKGFHVSPQQCEDKFNDLNKRYKRVNEILGKGTACRVVENQSLLDTMDHLSPKMKEEVKKLLNSKHLFFREMCTYHHSCAAASALAPPEPAQVQQQSCFHATETAPNTSNLGKPSKSDNNNEDEDEDSEDDDEDDEDEEGDDILLKKRKLVTSSSPRLIQEVSEELKGLMGDATKTATEKREWVNGKMLEVEEQGVRYRWEALEMEKERMKWVKFRGRKEREMEREKLRSERRRLEIERMILLLRQKELELLQLASNSTS
ncbi:hypothetical protein NMG60_11008363 [Bertholletia excelsa]